MHPLNRKAEIDALYDMPLNIGRSTKTINNIRRGEDEDEEEEGGYLNAGDIDNVGTTTTTTSTTGAGCDKRKPRLKRSTITANLNVNTIGTTVNAIHDRRLFELKTQRAARLGATPRTSSSTSNSSSVGDHRGKGTGDAGKVGRGTATAVDRDVLLRRRGYSKCVGEEDDTSTSSSTTTPAAAAAEHTRSEARVNQTTSTGGGGQMEEARSPVAKVARCSPRQLAREDQQWTSDSDLDDSFILRATQHPQSPLTTADDGSGQDYAGIDKVVDGTANISPCTNKTAMTPSTTHATTPSTTHATTPSKSPSASVYMSTPKSTRASNSIARFAASNFRSRTANGGKILPSTLTTRDMPSPIQVCGATPGGGEIDDNHSKMSLGEEDDLLSRSLMDEFNGWCLK